MIDDRFDPKTAEPRLYKAWEEAGAFQPQGEGAPFSIVIPPPNVTGVLHMGHALNNTLQDVLCRFQRMRGRKVLWQPGTDHAGIATQMVVERQLAQEGNVGRREMGREKFLERVWRWKEESGGAIVNQLKRLGATCDWSRERFTMGDPNDPNDQMVQAVIKVFVDLYNEGLIYRDKRLVNWDPHFQTAISDLEVENREVKGHMWHFKYPLAAKENGERETYTYVEKDADGNVVLEEVRDYIAIATTRPETMLGDGAVAVHPSDERYRPIVGKRVLLPLADRYIPIIADEYPDPEFGSGAVKITGAHDFNDYRVARRHDIPLYVLMDGQGRMADVDYVPKKYRGLDRFEARKQVVEDIEALGLLDRIEDKVIMQPFGDRSNVVIEPMLTDQWYVNAEELAKPSIQAVEQGDTRFVPEAWSKTYFEWMRNIEPWCVSRQLWWGHRIPAWYGPDGKIFVAADSTDVMMGRVAMGEHDTFVAISEAEAIVIAEKHYGMKVEVFDSVGAAAARLTSKENVIGIYRDEDVLDTWFSSALWPFSTMGWPQRSVEEIKAEGFYPTSVLVTAFDIIFFWVARMMMQGLHFMKEVPFHDVYIHALVLDEKGQKMSKSKGNVIDPLELIDEFGADALRFTLAVLAAQGRNIRLSKQRVEGSRNFATKLWNAFRFAQMNECALKPEFDPKSAKLPLNRWIIAEAAKTAAEAAAGIEAYKFNEAAGAAYRFVWDVVCDWYLELSKPVLNGEDAAAKAEVRATLAFVLDQVVHMLHPFMPFVTEELFQELSRTAGADRGLLIQRPWPELKGLEAPDAQAEVSWVIDLITAIRSARSDVNVPAGAKVPMALAGASAESMKRLETWRPLIERLARLESTRVVNAPPKGSIRVVAGEAQACLEVASLIDLAAESARLKKEIAKLSADIAGIDKKLANPQFVAKAPPEIIEEQHERRAAAEAAHAKLSAALSQLGEA